MHQLGTVRHVALAAAIIATLISVALSYHVPVVRAQSVEIWWPLSGMTLSGAQPIKAMVHGKRVEEYRMTWRVGAGTEVEMWNDYREYPHKEQSIDVSSWKWNGSGPYRITLTARDHSGQLIAESDVTVYTDAPAQTAVSPATITAPVVAAVTEPVLMRHPAETVSVTDVATSSMTLAQPVMTASVMQPASGGLYVASESNASRQAEAWRTSKPHEAGLMDYLAKQPVATWFGGWNADVRTDAKKLADAAKAAGAMPVLIAYNVPHRDCGGYSAGGTAHADAYRAWIGGLASGISGTQSIVVLEPDALASMDCLSETQKNERMGLLSGAIDTLKSAGAQVYLDAGHSSWVPAEEMAARLVRAGITDASGFALNVSNFRRTEDEVAYGQKVSDAVKAATGMQPTFVVDTARNGQGPNGSEWCNPAGRGLGKAPTLSTGHPLVAGFLWLKAPGESDGNCNGGPNAGVWWPEYAVGLVERRAQ